MRPAVRAAGRRGATLHREERGTVAIMAAMLLLALLAMLALVTDIGYGYGQRRLAQNVADAAAIAAAKVVAQNVQLAGSQTDAGVLQAMRDVARGSTGAFTTPLGVSPAVDRFTGLYLDNNNNPIGVTVGSAAGGAIPSAARGVRVVPVKTFATYFASAMGIGTLTVGARAAARFDVVTGVAAGHYAPFVLWAGSDTGSRRYLCRDANGNPVPRRDASGNHLNDPNGNPDYVYGCNMVGRQFPYRCTNYASNQCNALNGNYRWNYGSADFKGYLHQASGFLRIADSGAFEVQTGIAGGTIPQPIVDMMSRCYQRRAQGCAVVMPVADWGSNAGSSGISLRIIAFAFVRLDNDPATTPTGQEWLGTVVPGTVVFSGGNILIDGEPPAPGVPTAMWVRLVQ